MFSIDDLLEQNEKEILLWLWENKAQLVRRYQEEDIIFDYPQYGGMPENLKNTLNGSLVDWVQERVQTSFPPNRNLFLRIALSHQL